MIYSTCRCSRGKGRSQLAFNVPQTAIWGVIAKIKKRGAKNHKMKPLIIMSFWQIASWCKNWFCNSFVNEGLKVDRVKFYSRCDYRGLMINNPYVKKARVCHIFLCQKYIRQKNILRIFLPILTTTEIFSWVCWGSRNCERSATFSPYYCLAESKLEVMDRFGKLRVKSPRGTSAMLL